MIKIFILLLVLTSNCYATSSSTIANDGSGNFGIGTTTPSGGLIVMNGSVGIGTWIPDDALSVKGGTTGGIFEAYDNSGNPRLNISSTGNLGIGTFNATSLIKVSGNTNSYMEINIKNENGGASASSDYVATSNNGTDTTNYIDIGINGSGGGGAPFTTANHGYVYTSNFPLNIGAFGTTPFVTLNVGTNTLSPIEAIRVVASGNIGINSTVPGTTLDVNGTARAATFFTQNIGIGTTYTTKSALSVMNGNVGIGTWSPFFDVQVIGNVGIGTNGFLGIGTFNTNSNRLTVQGQVGIGTAINGTYGLSVMNGNVGIGTWTTANALTLRTGNVGIGTFMAGKTCTGSICIDNSFNNIGIGSSAPGAAVDIFRGTVRAVGIGTTVPVKACFDAQGRLGYYAASAWANACTVPTP